MGKNLAFSTNSDGTIKQPHAKKLKNEARPPTSHHIKKINSNLIKGLSVRAKIIKHLKENMGINDLGLGNDFLDVTPKITSNKRKNT